MNRRVLITKEAEENLAAVRNTFTREQLIKRIDSLIRNPEAGKPLRGILAGYRSLRGARKRYRIIYKYLQAEEMIVVIAIGLHSGEDFRDVYRSLKRMVERRKRGS